MAIPVEMPKMSDTMEEGVLVAWLVEEGTEVAAGDIIAQVETDKATMDLEVYDDGTLLKRVIGEGDAVPIGGLIAVLGDKGEDISAILEKYKGNGTADAETAEAGSDAKPDAEPEAEAVSTGNGQAEPAESITAEGRVKASPLARRMAREQGINLESIQGSGPEGRIIKRDVEEAMKAPPALAAKPEPAPQVVEDGELYTAVRISQMRKTIARRLAESKYSSPHFYLNVEVDMEAAIALRKQLNALTEAQEQPKISFNDLIIKACAVALRQHPFVNASYLEKEGEIRQHHPIHIGVAVAVPDGLVTPVVRNADQKGLAQIAGEVRELAEKAHNRKLTPEEMSGSTFTTSNLGMFGIERFTAIINPPNACILAIGAIRDVPVVKDGAVVPGKRMALTLSCDHRVVDGAVGARFLNAVQQYLEAPMGMML